MPDITVRQFLNRHQIRDTHILVAVSGGADSVSLLRVLHRLKGDFGLQLTVAHFNHKMRVDSTEDADWVCELCQTLCLPVFIGSTTHSLSDEASAREARYAFLKETCRTQNCSYLALGHTSNDQSETILHHIFRGTGLKGLTGIPEIRPLAESVALIRPLLKVSQTELTTYLQSQQQTWRTDATNEQLHYTRNRIRHQLLPTLREQFNPRVDEALIRMAVQAQESQQTLELLARNLLQQVLIETDAIKVSLLCEPLKEQPHLLVREMFIQLWQQLNWPRQNMTYERWFELADLSLQVKGSQLSLPGPIQASKRRKVLQLCKQDHA